MPGYVSNALEDLRNASIDGIHAISRALSALEICTTGIIGRSEDLKENYRTLADIDRATAEVRQLLDDAMRDVYDALRVMDSLR